ncbi:DUF4440 domain-containing protein [Lysobacteraceae bacterium NML03-0222]|nr:DUF4440 domain-containing protein [Xanthomonadaceae bacterium NML03-0222]
MQQSEPSPADVAVLIALEEAMWRAETRFDPKFMQQHLAADFIELGRSGRRYSRAQCLAAPPQTIGCRLPLSNLELRLLDADTAQLLYDSIVTRETGELEYTHRSSLWTRTANGWVMRFHQGTPFVPDELNA